MLGYSAEELIAEETPLIFHDDKEIQERARELTLEFQRDVKSGFEVFTLKPDMGVNDEHEWTYIRKDGNRITVSLQLTSLKDSVEERFLLLAK